ncbi:MAG: ATP-grasp domain-containing protein [Candidatus Bathyarchaeia archaeon]
MRVLIYEHVSGGGFAGLPVPSGVLSEGFGMLRGLVADFKAAGHYVAVMLDSRIAEFDPPLGADWVVPVFAVGEVQELIRRCAASADAVYVVAPESDGVLQLLLEVVEQTGVASLNCEAYVVGKVADKAVLYELLSRLGIAVPKTVVFGVDASVAEVARAVEGELRFPVIFKPSNDVSCGGLSLVRDKQQIAEAVAKIRRDSSSRRFLVQEFIRGATASVSLISTGNEALALSLNRQDVVLSGPEGGSSYLGGLVPFDHPLRRRAFEAVEKIVESFPGLRGYVGVDVVLTEKEAVVVEVNPRLTTSYVGLRQVVDFNLAAGFLNAVLKRSLPKSVRTFGYAYFSKVETCVSSADVLGKIYGMGEVVSPPFPIGEDNVAFGLVSTRGNTVNLAMVRFNGAKRRLLSIMG